MDMPGAEDLKRDSKMDVALGWCCCLEAIEGEREPVPWKSVFYRKEAHTHKCINKLEKRCFQHKVIKELKSFTLKICIGFQFLAVVVKLQLKTY